MARAQKGNVRSFETISSAVAQRASGVASARDTSTRPSVLTGEKTTPGRLSGGKVTKQIAARASPHSTPRHLMKSRKAPSSLVKGKSIGCASQVGRHFESPQISGLSQTSNDLFNYLK